MTVRALFSMGVNVLGGIYIYIMHTHVLASYTINFCQPTGYRVFSCLANSYSNY